MSLALRLVDGRNPRYANVVGEIVFQDPSIAESGPSAALVDKQAFLEAVELEGLTPVWVVAGEKGAYGSNERDFVGIRIHSFIYALTAGGEVECIKEFVSFDRGGAPPIQATKMTRSTQSKTTPSTAAKAPQASRASKAQASTVTNGTRGAKTRAVRADEPKATKAASTTTATKPKAAKAPKATKAQASKVTEGTRGATTKAV